MRRHKILAWAFSSVFLVFPTVGLFVAMLPCPSSSDYLVLHGSLAEDTLSLAGFSDVSDLEDAANALDIFIGVGEIDLSAAQRLQEELNRWVSEVPVAPPMSSVVEELRSLVSIELIGFDLGFSAVASGLQPVYDSLVTFGPFNVNDATLDEFAQGQLKVEIHGALPGSEKQHLLGQGVLPMAGLLQYGTQEALVWDGRA